MGKPEETSSAIDSGSGKLQLKNSHSIIQLRSTFADLKRAGANQDLMTKLGSWLDKQERENGSTRDYVVEWKQLMYALEEHPELRQKCVEACEDFEEYCNAVASGIIVPTPRPPAAAIVASQQTKTSSGVAAAIYGPRRRQA